jgi:hypothetical protein
MLAHPFAKVLGKAGIVDILLIDAEQHEVFGQLSVKVRLKSAGTIRREERSPPPPNRTKTALVG